MKNLYRSIYNNFDKLENTIRKSLRHHPLVYTFIGGIGIVLFWKGVWDIADMFEFMHGWVSLVVGTAILIVTGLFVSFFAGDSAMLTGLEEEERELEKTEAEVKEEMKETEDILTHIQSIEVSLEALKNKL